MPQFWRIVNVVLIAGTVIGILQPAFFEQRPLGEIFRSLYQPTTSQEFLMRWLLIFFLIALIYILIVDIVYRKQGLTIIRNIIDVRFINPDGSRVEMHREQILRANRSGVTAYYSRHTPDNGRIEGATITSSIFSRYRTINSQEEPYGSDAAGYEMLHLFSEPLPYGWFMPLVPVTWLNRDYNDLWRIFQRNLVVRQQSITYLDEFSCTTPSIDLMATIYPALNIVINMRFAGPVPAQLKARLIQDYAVTDVPCQRSANNTIQVHHRKLRKGERIKITW